MKLSVIVPAYNDLASVMRCMNSLGETSQTAPELLIQDDCSPALDFRGLVPFPAQTERNERNLGFAGNANAGARRASGDILAFINQDVYATPVLSVGWDVALLAAFLDERVGIVGGRLLFPDGKLQSAGGMFDSLGNPFHRCLGWANLNHEEIAEAREVDWTTGALLAIRRDLFAEVGGFDEGYVKGYWEDVDLAMRVRERGFKIMYEPGCTLVHTVGSTGGNAHFMQNALRFKQRWVDSGKVNRQANYIAVQRFW